MRGLTPRTQYMSSYCSRQIGKALREIPSCPVDDAKNASINRCDIIRITRALIFALHQQALGSPSQTSKFLATPHPLRLVSFAQAEPNRTARIYTYT